ncbi:hypothetical protein GLOIN_2v1877727 [Rhizophagus irregularis DAOM 181602=DAOM 197198]|nr:hypothetical protein GLOIN_2v1877727 [Rhizophagus irregularis DAOM 181602=DAOM 197198]
MTNVYTLKDINNKGHRLGSAYEQELEKKLYATLSSKAEINDLCEKLLAKNSEYSEREEDIGNKISQLNASSTKVRSQLISEQKSHSESQHALYSARSKLREENRAFKDQLALKKNTSSQIISSEGIPLESGGAEVVPLSQEIPLASAIPVVASSLMSPMITYSMLALLLIVVIWLVVRKWWNP